MPGISKPRQVSKYPSEKVSYVATKAAAVSLAASLSDGATVITDEDETATPAGVQTRRTVLSGALTAIASFLKTSMIAWKHGGTGAVWRTLYARLMDLPVSIKDFGATGGADDTSAIQLALTFGAGNIYISEGVFIANQLTGVNVRIAGVGTLKKKAGTKGALLSLTGDNDISGIELDYDWSNADQSLNYFSNNLIHQSFGSISVKNCRFRRSFSSAIYAIGANVTILGNRFGEAAPHNNLTGGNERVTDYVKIHAHATTADQFIHVNNNDFVGTSTDPTLIHLNPSGVFITSDGLDGARYKSVNICGNTFVACGQNAGNGNVTGAIDTYNGVENLVISGNTIRLFSHTGIKVQNSSTFSITDNVISEGSVSVGANINQSNGILAQSNIRGSVGDQVNGTISGNVMTDCAYTAITSTCDNVSIIGNIINGVTLAILGDAIFNGGSFVSIMGNIARNIEGNLVSTSGDKVKVIGNIGQSDTVAISTGIVFSGDDVDISHNSIVSSVASGGAGILTNGLSSNVRIGGNLIDGFPSGVDIRSTLGAVDNVTIGINQFKNITSSNINLPAGPTNVSVAQKLLASVSATYDPPSLAAGAASPVQTVAYAGTAIGDSIVCIGQRDMKGLTVVAWVSVAGTVSWYVQNPAGNPNGTQDLLNTSFKFVARQMKY